MGIASLILGILAFLISFSWFADLSLILGVLGAILGIIAIVKKYGKGFGIAGTILSVIALIIVFSNPTTSSDGKTGTGVTTDSGNGATNVKVSTDNVEIEKVGITKAGDIVLKVTNNNEGSVCLSSISTIVKDDSGNFVKKADSYNNFVCIPAKAVTMVYVWGYNEDFENYTNFEYSCELANISENFVYDNLDITFNNTGKQIAVTLKNNSDKSLLSSEVVVVYYKNDEVVGVEDGYSDSTTSAGSNCYINVDYPKDSEYDTISFDKYEVYYIKSSIN